MVRPAQLSSPSETVEMPCSRAKPMIEWSGPAPFSPALGSRGVCITWAWARRPNRADAMGHAKSGGRLQPRCASEPFAPAARSRLRADSLPLALIFPLWWPLPGPPLAITPQILRTNPDPGSHQIRVGSASPPTPISDSGQVRGGLTLSDVARTG